MGQFLPRVSLGGLGSCLTASDIDTKMFEASTTRADATLAAIETITSHQNGGME